MPQPILYQIKSWDATNESVVSFSYNGNQVFKNQVVIRNNLTNVIVYDQTQTTMQLKHNIAASSLDNNVTYNIQLRVFDVNNNPSSWSPVEIFKCFLTADFMFVGITESYIVQNSVLEVQLLYSQAENNPIEYYQFFMYDEHKRQLQSSPVLYSSLMKFIYSGFEDDKKYFIRAAGETINKTVLDTGYVGISAQYLLPSLYAIVELTNNHALASVRIHSNIITIEGISNPSPPTYRDNMVDLTDTDSWVRFDEGYAINNDFTIQIDATNFIVNRIPIVLKGLNNCQVLVKFMQGQAESKYSTQGYFTLQSCSGENCYYLISDYIPLEILNSQRVSLWIRRKNNIYEIKASRDEQNAW